MLDAVNEEVPKVKAGILKSMLAWFEETAIRQEFQARLRREELDLRFARFMGIKPPPDFLADLFIAMSATAKAAVDALTRMHRDLHLLGEALVFRPRALPLDAGTGVLLDDLLGETDARLAKVDEVLR